MPGLDPLAESGGVTVGEGAFPFGYLLGGGRRKHAGARLLLDLRLLGPSVVNAF